MTTAERGETIEEIQSLAAELGVAGTQTGEYRLVLLDRLTEQTDQQLTGLRVGLAVLTDETDY